MKRAILFLLFLGLTQWLPRRAAAQDSSSAGTSNNPPAATAPEEKTIGNFVVHQSVEFGYRFTDLSADKLSPTDPTNPAMYNTLVNLHDGPRLLNQTFSMHAPDHNGAAFDDLSFSSFGFGGDPNDVARLEVSKYKWYDFSGLFRRDWNFFDYNLLVNPLNPSTSSPSIPVLFSPHEFNLTRRMTDLHLTLAPESMISVRLNYGRNTFEGPSFTTIPEASDQESIETFLIQHNRTITDTYQVGIDFHVLPRTTISYDQFVTHTKYDTNWRDESFLWILPDGTPADLGIVWNTLNNQPCAVPFNPAQPVADPTCNLYLSYLRSNPLSTNTPTEQLSFRSNWIPRVDMTGRVSYSDLTGQGDFRDFFNGLLVDLTTRQFVTNGPISSERISASADFSATVHITNKLRIVDRFRFYNFGIPSIWNSTLATWLGTNALNPVGSNPDTVDNTIFSRFLGENTKSNEIAAEYDFSRRWGARLGYRYRTTTYHHFDEVNDTTSGDVETGADVIDVNWHTVLGGLWLHPVEQLRANFDAELSTADNFLTRTSPRRTLQYRFRANYRPNRWFDLAATANVYEMRNGVEDIRYNAHNRNFGFTATATGNERLGFELSYNFTNSGANGFICFQDTAAVVPGNPFVCAPDTDGGAPFEIYQQYESRIHFLTATLLTKPFKHLTANLGYSLVSSDGDTTIINPLQPYGSLRSDYHRPWADLQYDFGKGWVGIARWNYYGYGEAQAFFGPTYPRNFHANLAEIGVKYSF